MIQWLAHKDFNCFTPEWINVFWTSVFLSSHVSPPAGVMMSFQSLFEAWTVKSFSKRFSLLIAIVDNSDHVRTINFYPSNSVIILMFVKWK